MRFFGHDLAIKWASDSSVACAIGEHQSVGKIEHLATRSLWLQERIKEDAILPIAELSIVRDKVSSRARGRKGNRMHTPSEEYLGDKELWIKMCWTWRWRFRGLCGGRPFRKQRARQLSQLNRLSRFNPRGWKFKAVGVRISCCRIALRDWGHVEI